MQRHYPRTAQVGLGRTNMRAIQAKQATSQQELAKHPAPEGRWIVVKI